MAPSQQMSLSPVAYNGVSPYEGGGTGRKTKEPLPPLFVRSELTLGRPSTRPPPQPRKRKTTAPTTPALTFAPSQNRLQSGLQGPDARTPITPRISPAHEQIHAYPHAPSAEFPIGQPAYHADDHYPPATKRLRPDTITPRDDGFPQPIAPIPMHLNPSHSSPSNSSPHSSPSYSSPSHSSPSYPSSATSFYPYTNETECYRGYPSPASSASSSHHSPEESLHEYSARPQLYNPQPYQEDMNVGNCIPYRLDDHGSQYPGQIDHGSCYLRPDEFASRQNLHGHNDGSVYHTTQPYQVDPIPRH
ncbi:hypothetical protein BV22DRAFT_1195773 [Leucogyrophana mollusca]|uniref:Uncharacterized protein n=1 Tax=Leucogyrophana mollusca TaxID=85980 RepID=A0ACB8BIG9_9AGAM|nr:hypothetical protein BV22DRAFT_1195773 [Leucogyrophana mollusca]